MALVSDQLRAARERAGLTLEDVSARTKIKQSMLQAIETGDFDRLPGPFFTRAFIRSYARELRLPADEIVKDYVDELGPQPPEPLPVPPIRIDPPGSAPRLHAGPVLAAVVIVIVAMLVGGAGRHRNPAQPGIPGVVGTSGIAEASAAPAATDAAASESGTAPAPGEPIVLEIHPNAATWVAARADGQRVVYRVLQGGERTTVKARDEITLRIGNAAAFEYSINSLPGRALGGPSEVRDARITRDTIRSFRR
ncbi:MAG TPA: RodZ domain-containing protein [Vicinamibacterales bacterium]|nr:RodZ domain-containing protein [Vicinamibacterales bacterium]